jgi:hypothetical protein
MRCWSDAADTIIGYYLLFLNCILHISSKNLIEIVLFLV